MGALADGETLDYIATSPQAVYDSNRNKRALKRELNKRKDLLDQHERRDHDLIMEEEEGQVNASSKGTSNK